MIFSSTWSEHLGHIRCILENFMKVGATLNPGKCCFGETSAKFLGYVIGDGKIQASKEKTEAIVNCKRPSTKKEVRAFLGMANYYRRLIKDYAKKSLALTNLLADKVPDLIPWSEAEEGSFQSLKDSLVENAVNHSPDWKQPFYLETDASGEGLGAVLTQRPPVAEEMVKAVAFYSRKLRKHEKNYAVTELEGLALVEAIKHFDCYLANSKFYVVTDHKPLKSITALTAKNSRLLRWSLFLQDCDFEIIYRAGKENVRANCLSRLPSTLAKEEGSFRLGVGKCDASPVGGSAHATWVPKFPVSY